MMVLDQRVAQRRANYAFYHQALSNLPGFHFLDEPAGFFSNRWLTCLTINPEQALVSREQIRLTLEKANIESRPLWKPMHLQPVFEGCPAYVNGVSEDLFKHGLCLPSGSNLTSEQLCTIVELIKGA